MHFIAIVSRILCFGVALTLGCFATLDARAGTWFVDHRKTDDNGDGRSWSTASKHLQTALSKASGGDSIWIAQGVYYPDEGEGQTNNNPQATFRLKDGLSLYGGFAGTEAHLTERATDPATHPTVLSGDIDLDDFDDDGNRIAETTATLRGRNAYHVISNFGGECRMDRLTITAGQALASGGGVYLSGQGLMNFVSCRFIGNSASVFGGAVVSLFENQAHFTDCHFSGNVAGECGGALYSSHFTVNTLTDCHFENNEAYRSGGAFCYASSAAVTLRRCSVLLNRASDAGGGVIDQSGYALEQLTVRSNENGGLRIRANHGTVMTSEFTFNGDYGVALDGGHNRFTDCIFSSNESDGLQFEGRNVQLTRCQASDNGGSGVQAPESEAITIDGLQAVGNGESGLVIGDRGSVVENATLSDNQQQGLLAEERQSSGPPLSARHCLVERNRQGISATRGEFSDCVIRRNTSGGIQLGHGMLANSIVTGNSAENGGGIVSTDATFLNCVIAGNYARYNGGGMSTHGSAVIINCVLYGNRSDDHAGAIRINNRPDRGGSAPTLHNTIVWNNSQASGIYQIEADGGPATYSHCLVEFFHPAGTGNLDGRDAANAPRFAAPTDPADAPMTGGDFHPLADSSTLDAGDSASNPSSVDLDGNPRVVGIIDLGPYERPLDTDGDSLPDLFELANTIPSSAISLQPGDDNDADGLNALEEFAHGLSDLSADAEPPVGIEIFQKGGERYFAISYRQHTGATSFVDITVLRTPSLGEAPWTPGHTLIFKNDPGETPFDRVIGARSKTPISAQEREFLGLQFRPR